MKLDLIIAAKNADFEKILALLEEFPSLEARKNVLSEILLLSTKKGRAGAVEVLIKAGADVNTCYACGMTPIMYAASLGYDIIVDILLAAGAKIIVNRDYIENSNKETALMSATNSANPIIIASLLKAGADVNAVNACGISVLIYAIRRVNPAIKMVEMLLQAGANVNAVDDNGRTALGESILYSCSPLVVDTLLLAGAELSIIELEYYIFDMMYSAVEYGFISILQMLLATGTDVNCVDKNGKTILILAIEKGEYSAVRLLIEAGADLNTTDSAGNTPLIIAVKMRQPAILELLLTVGANVNYVSQTGMYALESATIFANPEAVNILLEHPSIHSSVTPSLIQAAETNYTRAFADDDSVNVIKYRKYTLLICQAFIRWQKVQFVCAKARFNYDVLPAIEDAMKAGVTVKQLSHMRDSDGFTLLGAAASNGISKQVATTLVSLGLSVLVCGDLKSTSVGDLSKQTGQYFTAGYLYYSALKQAARTHSLFNTIRSTIIVGAKNLPVDIINNILEYCATEKCCFIEKD